MNEDKMSREEVPQRFNDWLLHMGCPPEKVPSLDKMAEMCRGQYYMVWRSLMEHVHPKDIVKQQRLQVFHNDVQKCSKNTNDKSVIVPQELAAWREHNKLKNFVETMEISVNETRNKLEQVTAHVSKKLVQRNMSRRSLQDSLRRVWFLQTFLAEELTVKRDNLNQMLGLARELSHQHDAVEIHSKLETCLSSVKTHIQSSSTSVSAIHPVASSSVTSNNSDIAENYVDQLSELVKCRADVLWTQLYEKRTKLVETLSNQNKLTIELNSTNSHKITPQMVLAHTCSLYCQLVLETMKQKLLLKQAQNELAQALTSINQIIPEESRESLVLKCEQSEAEARLGSLKKLLQELTSRTGVFESTLAENGDDKVTGKHIAQIENNIITKKDNIKRIITNISTTESKINNARQSLVAIFDGLQIDGNGRDSFGNKIFQNTMYPEALTSLREYFQRCNEKRMARVDLSLNLDSTEGSFNTSDNMSDPRFVDELRLYFTKFNLENNRKLVLESGEKIWSFETLQASADRILSSLINEDASCHFICPSDTLTDSLTRLADGVRLRNELVGFLQAYEGKLGTRNICFDLEPLKNEEEAITDKIKKCLNECLISLNKTNKTLDTGWENIKIWRDNDIKKYVSHQRTLQGRAYQEWETLYLQYLNPSF